MDEAQNMLDEFQVEPKPASRFFISIIVLFSIFISFMIVDMFFDLGNMSFKFFEWDWISILLGAVIPGLGLFLFIRKTKIGWCITTAYVSLIAIAGTIATFNNAVAGGSELLTPRQCFILLINISLNVLLQARNTRDFLKVGNTAWVLTIAFSLLLAILLTES